MGENRALGAHARDNVIENLPKFEIPNLCGLVENIGRGKHFADLAVWKRTPNLYTPSFYLTYQARISSRIVGRCYCFITLKG